MWRIFFYSSQNQQFYRGILFSNWGGKEKKKTQKTLFIQCIYLSIFKAVIFTFMAIIPQVYYFYSSIHKDPKENKKIPKIF